MCSVIAAVSKELVCLIAERAVQLSVRVSTTTVPLECTATCGGLTQSSHSPAPVP